MTGSSEHIVVIEAGHTESAYWRDLWRYRELFYFLAWRDILVRYKQTVMGVLWALIRPILTMIVFVIVFGKLAKLPSDGLPYPILVLTAMLPWQFFVSAFSGAGNSLVSNANIISKVYFPRLIIPLSSVIVSFVDFLIGIILLSILMFWFAVVPDIRVFLLPVFTILVILLSIGIGCWTAALNVKYRDFGYIVPFVAQFGLFVSPVAFSSSIVPEKWKLIYSMNPMVGIIDGFRWCLSGQATPLYWPAIAFSVGIIFLLLFSGLHYFRVTEKSFADVI